MINVPVLQKSEKVKFKGRSQRSRGKCLDVAKFRAVGLKTPSSRSRIFSGYASAQPLYPLNFIIFYWILSSSNPSESFPTASLFF